MSKLDEPVVEWIIREKRKGCRNKQIAETAGVSIHWVQRLWAGYKGDYSQSPQITTIECGSVTKLRIVNILLCTMIYHLTRSILSTGDGWA